MDNGEQEWPTWPPRKWTRSKTESKVAELIKEIDDLAVYLCCLTSISKGWVHLPPQEKDYKEKVLLGDLLLKLEAEKKNQYDRVLAHTKILKDIEAQIFPLAFNLGLPLRPDID